MFRRMIHFWPMNCQCQEIGSASPSAEYHYDPETEWPFVNHEPGKCKCVKDLKEYIRDGEVIALCSCCCRWGDKEVAK